MKTKLIALDTNAVSELMKIVNPNYPKARRARVSAAWADVLIKLTTASQLHEVSCPRTPTLDRESLLCQHGPAIEQMAKRFDGELWCHPQHSIEGQQLNLAAKAHANTKPVTLLHRNYVYGGDLNAWSNWFRIEVDMGYARNPPDQVRAARDKMHASAIGVFDRWAKSKTRLNEIYQRERRAMGRVLVASHLQHLAKLHRHCVGQEDMDPLDLLNQSSHQVAMIRYGLEGPDGGSPDIERVLRFALSDEACDIPINRVRAALYAYEARQVAGGMRKPKASMWLDVEMISTMLPYVDAMLVEGHFAAGLQQVRGLLPEECRYTPVFSTRELSKFVEYLDGLIAAVPENQRRAADALYNTDRLEQQGCGECPGATA